jgi:hypothetical protein
MRALSFIFAISLTTVACPQGLPTPVQFNVAPSYKVGAGPVSVVAADFNGDGKMDLATANSAANSVSILLGKGDGSFGSSNDYPVGRSPSSVAVADFNADGWRDLVTANRSEGTVSVLINNGNGTFRAGTPYKVGTSPIFAVAGKLGRESGVGIVALNTGDSTISVIQDGGIGTGVTVTNYDVGGYRATSLALADFDQDATIDIAVITAYHPGATRVFLNRGDGKFDTPIDSRSGSFSSSVAIGDFNRDAKMDLVTADSGGTTVLMGNGNGTFTRLTNYVTLGRVIAVAVGDFNGDGDLDHIALNTTFLTNDNLVTVLLANGDGTFTRTSDYAVGKVASSIAIADFNNDGKLDIAVADSADNSVSVLLGNGDGTFAAPANFALTSASSILGPQKELFAGGDINGDGFPDLIVANGSAGTVSVMANTGQGSFREVNYFKSIPATSIAASDLSGDGKLDLVIGSSNSKTVTVMLGNNDGTFNTGDVYYLTNYPGFIAMGDLDGDGTKDLVIANSGTNTVSILLGAGDGSFSARQRLCGWCRSNLNGDRRPQQR